MTQKRVAGEWTWRDRMFKELTRTVSLVAALLLGVPVLAACSDDETAPAQATQTAANGETFNDADVAFATDMIPHHAQANEMVNLTRGRGLDPAVQEIADGILTTQAAEVETMVDWLTAWDRPIPPTSQDHANAHAEGAEMHGDLPGMMTEEQMAELEAARGGQFQRLWLEMMIAHHEGAIEMAATEVEDGEFPDAVAMADSIRSTQQAEVNRMRDLLGS